MSAYLEGSLTSLVCALYILDVNVVYFLYFLFTSVVNFLVNIWFFILKKRI